MDQPFTKVAKKNFFWKKIFFFSKVWRTIVFNLIYLEKLNQKVELEKIDFNSHHAQNNTKQRLYLVTKTSDGFRGYILNFF